MATANTVETLNGLFKEVYADKLENLIPDGVKLLNRIKFTSQAKSPGNFYHQPVILGLEHGVTFNNGDGSAFNLNSAVAGTVKDATVRGTEMVLRSILSYSAASRSVGAGPKAFMDGTKFLVENMMRSVSKKLEIELLYGKYGYGVVDSTLGNVITIEESEYAEGIWSGAEGLPIEIRSSAGILRGSANVTAVDIDNLTVTVDALPAGVVATDVIWHKGAFDHEFAGIHNIITNSGSLFGIDASQFNLWKGNEFAPSSTSILSFAIIQQAISKAIAKGLDGDVMVLVNPGHWDDLLTEQAALRMYDSSYKSSQAENGAASIKFHGQSGMIEISPSIYVKRGYAYVLSLEQFMRVGSTDVTFKRPGEGDQFFRDLENSAGYELRLFTDQALFCQAPGKNVLISNLKIA